MQHAVPLAAIASCRPAELAESDILAEIVDTARRGGGAEFDDEPALRAPPGALVPVDLHRLLARHGAQFVTHAFAELLGRPPDAAALDYYTPLLTTARVMKPEILGRIRFSPEGRKMGRNVPGLRQRFWMQRSYRVPLMGRVLRIVSAVLLLPRTLRDLQRMQETLAGNRARLDRLEKIAASLGPGLAARMQQIEARLQDIEALSIRLAAMERRDDDRAG